MSAKNNALPKFPMHLDERDISPHEEYSEEASTREKEEEKKRVDEAVEIVLQDVKNLKIDTFQDESDDEAPVNNISSSNSFVEVTSSTEVQVNDSEPIFMNYYETLTENRIVDDQFQYSHTPFTTEAVNYERVTALIADYYENGVHGAFPNDHPCSTQILFDVMKRLLPTTINADLLYYTLYLTFRNVGTQEQFSEMFPKLVRMFEQDNVEITRLLNLETWKRNEVTETARSWPVGVKHPCSKENFFMKHIRVPRGTTNDNCSNGCYHSISEEQLKNLQGNTEPVNGKIKVNIRKSIAREPDELNFLNFFTLHEDELLVENFCEIVGGFESVGRGRSCSEWFTFLLEVSEYPRRANEWKEPREEHAVRIQNFKAFMTRLKVEYNAELKRIENENNPHRKSKRGKKKSVEVPTIVDVTPCCHIGPCGPDNIYCSCKHFCSTFCQCDVNCQRKFPGCNCTLNQCGRNGCPCYDISWECDESSCESCLENGCGNNEITRRLCKKLDVRRTEKTGNGLFAGEDLNAADFLGEYTGERISGNECRRRDGVDCLGCSYQFNVPGNCGSIDSKRAGNKFRFINHSLKPNCYSTPRVCKGTMRIVFYADQKIKKGTELFFNYGYIPKMKELFFETHKDDRVPTYYDDFACLKRKKEAEEKEMQKKKQKTTGTNESQPSTSSNARSSSSGQSTPHNRRSGYGPSTSTAKTPRSKQPKP